MASLSQASDANAEAELAHGVDIVHAATDAQLRRAGLATVDSAPAVAHGSPADAVRALAAQQGVPLTPDERQQAVHLDTLPDRVFDTLAATVGAFHDLHAASAASFGAADPALARSADSPAQAWANLDVDPVPVMAERAALLDAIVQLESALEAEGPLDAQIELAPVVSIDLSHEDDTYERNVALQIDAGGSDTYHNRAGGTGDVVGTQPAAALVDLGGQDTYGQPALDAVERPRGTNGGGASGVGLLVDDGPEDDVYAGGADGTNGGAFVGAGLLLDTGGWDTYSVAGWGANGGGYPAGIGQLVDLGGWDTYTGLYEAVNGGGLLGTGLLYDAAGWDTYEATFSGTNGGGASGDGLLYDAGTGDDTYQATHGGVNGGTSLAGQGLLYDEGGTDTYEDDDGGSGEDRTVVPKGIGGAQVDAETAT